MIDKYYFEILSYCNGIFMKKKGERCEHDSADRYEYIIYVKFNHSNYILFMYFLYSISSVYGFDLNSNKQ